MLYAEFAKIKKIIPAPKG